MGKVIVMNWAVARRCDAGAGPPRRGHARRLSVRRFGRWTYEQLLTYWNAQGGPFKDPLNNIHKYVASSNPETKLEWPNSTLLHGVLRVTDT